MSAKADDQSGQMRQWATRAGNGRPNDLRFHHRRRRLGGLGAGQPPVGQEQQPGAPARSRAGHAARQGAARGARQLSRHRLLRSALSLDRSQGAHRGRLPQQSRGEPAAAAQIRAGAHPRRRLLHQRPARQPRRAGRLRRVGSARRRAAGAGTDVLPYYKKVERDMDFDGSAARQGGAHSRAAHLPRAVDRPRQGRRRGLQGGGLRVPARPERRVARRLLSRSPSPTPTSGACRPPSAISIPARAMRQQPRRSRPTRRCRSCCSRAGAASAWSRASKGVRAGVPRQGGDPLLRRHPLAGAPVARRHRPRRAPEGARHRGQGRLGRRRPAA